MQQDHKRRREWDGVKEERKGQVVYIVRRSRGWICCYRERVQRKNKRHDGENASRDGVIKKELLREG